MSSSGRPLEVLPPTASVAVIGAGMAGVAVALGLQAGGRRVLVLDKARGRGGRMSTRRDGAWAFDHGAQYFTARHARFRDALASWKEQGVVARWDARLVDVRAGAVVPRHDRVPRWVARPRMSALCRHLAAPLDVRPSTRAVSIRRRGGAWDVVAESGEVLGPFDAVVVAVPAAQAVPLLADAPDLAARVAGVHTDPCWAVMAGLDRAVNLGFDGAFVHDADLAWMACNDSKPDRSRAAGPSWVLHASPTWSQAHEEAEAGEVAEFLWKRAGEALGRELPRPAVLKAHRWLLALTTVPLGRPYLWDARLGLGACGDWCLGARVEAAWRSGTLLADSLIGATSRD